MKNLTLSLQLFQGTAWATDAFDDKHKEKYWNSAIEIVQGKHALRPLHDRLKKKGKNICFTRVEIGASIFEFYSHFHIIIIYYIYHVDLC